jgi:hypothetical protein
LPQTVGVGHFTANESGVPPCAYGLLRELVSLATGVGHKPEPVTLVRRPNIGSSQHRPSAVIPERGQVTEHSSESPSNDCWTVLHEDEARSNVANDPCHVRPHAGPLAVNACTLSGNADVLARKPARNHVNKASPRSSVKGLHVIPNRERREKAVILSGEQYTCGVGLPLDGADGSPSEQVATKNASTSAREKCQLMHGSPRHFETLCAPAPAADR